MSATPKMHLQLARPDPYRLTVDPSTDQGAAALYDADKRADLLDRLAATAIVMRAAEHDAPNATQRELFHDASLELQDAIVQLRLWFSSDALDRVIDLTERQPSSEESGVSR